MDHADNPALDEVRKRHHMARFAYEGQQPPQAVIDIGVLLTELDSRASVAAPQGDAALVDREDAAAAAFDATKTALVSEHSYSTLQVAASVAASVRKLSPVSPSPKVEEVASAEQDDVDYFDPVSLLEKAMRTTMEIGCDCPRELGTCDGECVGSRIWQLIHRARKLIKATPVPPSEAARKAAEEIVGDKGIWHLFNPAADPIMAHDRLIDRLTTIISRRVTATVAVTVNDEGDAEGEQKWRVALRMFEKSQKALSEVAQCAQGMLTALNVGDVQSGSPLHLKLREVMIAYRARPTTTTDNEEAK